MSKSIDKDLKAIENCFKGFFKDLNTIAANIAAINKTRADMEATGNYTPAYIEDVLEKEKTAKAASNASAIDIITASVEDLQEAAKNILNASDVLEDVRIAPALASVGSLEGAEGVKAAEIIARQFSGNFPALNLLSATAKDARVKTVFTKASIDADGLEAMADNIGGALISLTSYNSALDFVGLTTRVYQLNKTLKADAAIFGVNINAEDYKALAELLEAKHDEDVRKAMGL